MHVLENFNYLSLNIVVKGSLLCHKIYKLIDTERSTLERRERCDALMFGRMFVKDIIHA